MVNVEKRRRTAVPNRATKGTGAAAGTPAARTRAVPEEAGLGAKLRYRFDLALARGPFVVIGYLGLVMLLVILVATLFIWALGLQGMAGGNRLTAEESFWQALLRVLDSGTFAADAAWPDRVVGLVVTLSGIFLAGSLIGLIANAVDRQVENLRKGRSRVLETGHTLVLGWSERLPAILSEIVVANENQRRPAFVVLSSVPKDEMEDILREKVRDTRTTRVVCRTGDPSRLADLAMVNATGARSIIILGGDEGDAGTIKALLAVRALDPDLTGAHVVAELSSAENARTLHAVTEGRIATVVADDVIARVTAQACHQSGLSAVYRELLDFDGDEIYFAEIPAAIGRRYDEVVTAFDASSIIGVCDAGGTVTLNPPAETVIVAGDRLVAISEDDDTIVLDGFRTDPPAEGPPTDVAAEEPQRILVVGWSVLGAVVLDELDAFLTAGSTVDLVVDTDLVDVDTLAIPDFAHTTVTVRPTAAGPEELLDLLRGVTYDQAIVLGYRESLTASEADARTMLTLLTLNQAGTLGGGPTARVVAEMLDRANVAIAQTTGVDDFVVSDELSSLMIAQLSEHLELQQVFDELFDVEGCSVALHPARAYHRPGSAIYRDLVTTALGRGATAIGYRQAGGPVVVNPAKETRLDLGPDDQLLLIAPHVTRRPGPGAESVAGGVTG